MSGCAPCGRYRQAVGYASCREVRLCDRIDLILVDRHPGVALDRLVAMHEQITLGGADGARLVEEQRPFLGTSDAFLQYLCDLHRCIFVDAEPEFAGRFRRGGEIAQFGGSGVHGREGSDPEEIGDHLRELHRALPSSFSDHDERKFSRRAAWFLERFFMIHPFVDGNGRVARLVLDSLALSSGKWRFDQSPMDRKAKHAYVRALELAHRETPANHDDRASHSGRDPLRLLAPWVQRRLIVIPADWDVLQPPEDSDTPE